MRLMNSRFRLMLVFTLVLVCMAAVPAHAATTTIAGSFPDGATYLIEVPSPWNGTLLLVLPRLCNARLSQPRAGCG